MKTPPTCCLLLGVLLVSAPTDSAASLIVSPNQQQFRIGDPVSLSCEGRDDADDWNVKKTEGHRTESCGSTCSIGYQFGSGVYWCEDGTGEKSDWVNITVSGAPLILEIPALPVITGSDVTLLCRHSDESIFKAYFFINGTHVGNKDRGQQFIIKKVQKSDEGLYWCSTDKDGSSPRSFLRVRDPPPTSSSPTSGSTSSSTSSSTFSPPTAGNHTLPPPSSIFVPVLAAVGSLVALVLVLVLGLGLRKKQTGRNLSSPPDDITYSEVTFQQRANKNPANQSDVRPAQSDDSHCRYTLYYDPTGGHH